MAGASLDLTRAQILSFRRRVGALDERLAPGASSLRQVAWAGLQDSMPRAALISVHARMQGTEPSTWEHPSLVQLWGPRHSVFVVAERDRAVFSLGTLGDDGKGRQRAEQIAQSLREFLAGRRLGCNEVANALGCHVYRLRYAAETGTVLIRWDGAHRPTLWTVPEPAMSAADARLELARRYLHVYGPAAAGSFGLWAGIGPKPAGAALAALGTSLVAVRTPVGEGWILAADEEALRSPAGAPGAVRLLPSGDAFTLLQGADRALLVPDAKRQAALWTPRVWPGGLLAGGEIQGTWRRAEAVVTVAPWRKLSRAERDAVAGEVESLPLPGFEGRVVLRWEPSSR